MGEVKTDYALDDRRYRRHRDKGFAGWEESASEYSRWQADCENVLSRGLAPARGLGA